MKEIRVFFRFLTIGYILSLYRIDEFMAHSGWFYFFRFISLFNPIRYTVGSHLSRGERARLALERLGPIFVKFGQLLSTRRDLLPEDIANELAKLQDQVKPFSGSQAVNLVEDAFKKPISELFISFDQIPLASASVAQVHAATLPDGKEVVVKIIRPKAKKAIEQDLELMRAMAKLANRFLQKAKKLKPIDLVNEFENGLRAELDLLREAANATTLRRYFKNSNLLYIPEIFWPYCKKNVMVMQRIYGIPVNETLHLKKEGFPMAQLAKNVMQIFFEQVFDHNFFHADMHPGNLFVNIENRAQFIAVDFGIVGSLTERDRRYIAENLLAFFHRDYRRVAELHLEAGWIDNQTEINEFEAAIRTISEPVFEKPLKDISMGHLIMNLVQIAREFNIQIQPQLILLQKTLLNVEALARQFDPDLDLWKTAKPFLEKWLRQQMGLRSLIKRLRRQLPFWLEKLPEMPDLIYEALRRIATP